MKYINKFSTNADYQAFTDGDGYVTPNICFIEGTKGLIFKPKPKPIPTFIIDDIVFEKSWLDYSGNSSKLANLYDTLKKMLMETEGKDNYRVNNKIYKIDNPNVKIYLYNYELPLTYIQWISDEYCIKIATDFFNFLIIPDSIIGDGMSEGWNFSIIPSNPIKAIMCIEAAKQLGLDIFTINGFTVEWGTNGKSLIFTGENICYYVDDTGYISENPI
jgi:hypothetical protein